MVVTPGKWAATAVTRHRPCGRREAGGPAEDRPGAPRSRGKLRGCVAVACHGPGRKVLVSARTRQITRSAVVERERVTTWIRIRSPNHPLFTAAPRLESPYSPLRCY